MSSAATNQRGINSPWDALIWAQAGGDGELYALIKGVISQESGWKPDAENLSDPSAGLMQILYGPKGPYPMMTREQLLDPETSIILGSRFLLGLVSRQGIVGGVSAYNQGEGGYLRRGVINWDYVNSVIDNQLWFGDNDPMIAEWGGLYDERAESRPEWSGAITTEGDIPADVIPAGAGMGLGLAVALGIFLIARRML